MDPVDSLLAWNEWLHAAWQFTQSSCYIYVWCTYNQRIPVP